MAARRVLVLNSYTLTGKRPEEQVRIRAFLEGLEQGGYRRGHEVDVDIVDSNSLSDLEEFTRKAVRQKQVDVIHAVGTPNAIVAANTGNGVPVVYYGAHPEGAGEAACRKAGAVGMVLTLPFTQSYKRFRLIRTLFSWVKRVWVPFYEGTVFCRPEMKEKHRLHRSQAAGGSPWIEGGSPLVGYRSLASLCFIIDLEYRELVYRDADDLRRGLEWIDRTDALLMPYNDSVYCEGAPRTLAECSVVRHFPLLWNNNAEATQIGAVAAVAGCMREAGLETGKLTASILDGAKPSTIKLLTSTRTFASLNRARARDLGVPLDPEITAHFDEIL